MECDNMVDLMHARRNTQGTEQDPTKAKGKEVHCCVIYIKLIKIDD